MVRSRRPRQSQKLAPEAKMDNPSLTIVVFSLILHRLSDRGPGSEQYRKRPPLQIRNTRYLISLHLPLRQRHHPARGGSALRGFRQIVGPSDDESLLRRLQHLVRCCTDSKSTDRLPVSCRSRRGRAVRSESLLKSLFHEYNREI